MTQLEEKKRIGFEVTKIDMQLEVIVIPVSDVDRSKRFIRSWGGGWPPTSGSITDSGSSNSHRQAPRRRYSSERRLRRRRPARPKASTWLYPTSREPAKSWSPALSRSVKCFTPERPARISSRTAQAPA